MPVAVAGGVRNGRRRVLHPGPHVDRAPGPESEIAVRVGSDVKGRISVAIYIAAIGLSFVSQWIALALIVAVAAMWLVPDRRFEREA